MEFVILWLLVVIEKISAVLTLGDHLVWLGLVLVFCVPAFLFLVSSDKEQFAEFTGKTKRYRTWGWVFIVWGTLSYGVGSILPNQKEMAIIVGGGLTYNILTSDEAKQIGGKSLELLNKKFDELLKDEELQEKLKSEVKQTVSEI